jgi:LL-diaminopimelate aminotransferase
MPSINPCFEQLSPRYIFPFIEQKLAELQQTTPEAKILNFGIGDIAEPLATSIVHAICSAVQEMGWRSSMRGYGPSTGYSFLKEAIVRNLYAHLGIESKDIFISDGINSDIVNILDLFAPTNRIAIPNPSYPAYKDACIIEGLHRSLLELPCTRETGFLPRPPSEGCDLIFLCSPHNPTGMAFTRMELKEWVEYALRWNALILYDSAYSCFVNSEDTPRSIFEIEGAQKVAIECCSFSKSAGFTGLRCAYMVIPSDLEIKYSSLSLQTLWNRRQTTKFNGVAYPIQKGALASLEGKGKEETEAQVRSYLYLAQTLSQGLRRLGFTCFGGRDAPYIWWRTPDNITSWEFFDLLLHRCQMICIPGEGFGSCGEQYVRLSAFTTAPSVQEALDRLATL